MNISKDELIAVLAQFNPWWQRQDITDLPAWHRAAFGELFNWIYSPPVNRAILLSGARQIGKTTLLQQAIAKLLKLGVPAANILYATFDHPIIKLAGINAVLEAWRTREPQASGAEYIFLDEAQFIRDGGTWVKHQVDFNKGRRIIFTGSAMPLIHKEQESGVGRWHTIRLTTLSFYEYLKLKQFPNRDFSQATLRNLLIHNFQRIESLQIDPAKFTDTLLNIDESFSKIIPSTPDLPRLRSLNNLFEWSPEEFRRISEIASPYVGYFHDYLVRGGFPQTAQVESINQAQRLLREDIIDKVLKRDMTALFGVRRVLELEQTFLYLCLHGGGLLDIQNLCGNLGLQRPTVQKFIELLEAAHLIYRLQPFGYGREILRAKYKIYLADAAIASAVLLKGKSILDDPTALGVATETAVFKHLFARYYSQNVRFTYWQGNKKQEVDLVAEINNQIIPFEVKYRSQHTGAGDLKGFLDLCQKKSIERGYVITKSLDDFGPLSLSNINTRIMRIPAPLLCYWMGASELFDSEQNTSSSHINMI